MLSIDCRRKRNKSLKQEPRRLKYTRQTTTDKTFSSKLQKNSLVSQFQTKSPVPVNVIRFRFLSPPGGPGPTNFPLPLSPSWQLVVGLWRDFD